MKTLAGIALTACQVLGIDDSATVEQAKVFARDRWSMLWSAELWPQSRTVQPATLPATAAQLTVPVGMELVTLVRRTDTGEVIAAESEIAAILSDPSAFRDGAATPFFWCQIAPSGSQAVLRFSSAPRADLLLTLIGKAPCPDLANDDAKPTIPGADLALVAHVTADLYEWQRQMGKSQTKRQEALALESRMAELARIQSGNMVRIVPEPEGDWDGRFPFAKA